MGLRYIFGLACAGLVPAVGKKRKGNSLAKHGLLTHNRVYSGLKPVPGLPHNGRNRIWNNLSFVAHKVFSILCNW
jgi:hypothetical protein